MQRIDVAVGVVMRGRHTFITHRAEHLHQGGKWEFPGGKIATGETPIEGLSRELAEEIGIQTRQADPLITIEHDYPDKHVALHVFVVSEFAGEPFGKEGQDGKWCALEHLDPAHFPAANGEIITALLERYA